MEKLPEAIHRYVHAHFANGHITNVKTIGSGKELNYIVNIKLDEVQYHLQFDDEGKFLNKLQEKRFDTEYTYEDFFDD